MDLKTLVGNLATVFTLGVFLSGIQVCRKIWHKKSTADISALPFICGVISCSLWLIYGVYVNDPALIIVNLPGLMLQLLYVLFYALFAIHKDLFLKQIVSAFSVLALLYFYTSVWISDVDTAKEVTGFVACTAGVIFISSPLVTITHVIRTRSVESLPFAMILFSFIMASLWLWYGILMNDRFIQVPNFLGALMSGCQLSLFAVCPSKKTYTPLRNEVLTA